MDIEMFRNEEQFVEVFTPYDSSSFLEPYPDILTGLDLGHNFTQNDLYEWNMDNEREINGDIALIPMCDISVTGFTNYKDDCQKILNDMNQSIDIDSPCPNFGIEDPIGLSEEYGDEIIQGCSPIQDPLNLSNIEDFDITTFLSDSDHSESPISQPIPVRKPKAGVKRIDLKAQCYILDDEQDDIDIETVSDCNENSPVLEAGDIASLLEQFEATQIPNLPIDFIETDPSLFEFGLKHKEDYRILEDNCINLNNVYKNPDSINVNEESTYETKVNVKIEQEVIEIAETILTQPGAVNVKSEPLVDDIKVKTEEIHDEPKRNNRKIGKTVSIQNKESKVKKGISQSTSQVPPRNVVKQPPKTEPKTTRHSKKKPPSIPVPPKYAPLPGVSKAPHVPIARNRDATTSFTPPASTKNKQTIDIPPQHIIDRIKQSGKRKTISVIDPVPTKKRCVQREGAAGTAGTRPLDVKAARPLDVKAARPSNFDAVRPSNDLDNIRLDHDYCLSSRPYVKHPKKDSGFESSEEDERFIEGRPMGKPPIFKSKPPMGKQLMGKQLMGKQLMGKPPLGVQLMDNQPIVQNADGTMMVSLLKVNSIPDNVDNKKKKLNLEEYKKRRHGFLKSQSSSHSSSSIGSASNSPQPQEDEHTRLMKHQEKLRRMALEVLNTPPKTVEKKPETPLVIAIPKPVEVPPNLVMRTTVSVAVDTQDLQKVNDPLASNEQLASIRPLLQKAKVKIDSSSLIASVIEQLPKVADKGQGRCDAPSASRATAEVEHGEDRTVAYLEKARKAVETRTVACQTEEEEKESEADAFLNIVGNAARSRRRISESSSYTDSSSNSDSSRSASRYDRRRNTRRNSISSRSSSRSRSPYSRKSSSRYSSPRYSTSSLEHARSRSRSLSPRSVRERERYRAVVERRVVYVGEVPPNTTKEYLRMRFRRFGPITDVSLHSRKNSPNNFYGFVTFVDISDALKAIDHGNDDPTGPRFKLSFGGRRVFCETNYADLDNMQEQPGYYQEPYAGAVGAEESFEDLLRETNQMRYIRDMRKMRKKMRKRRA